MKSVRWNVYTSYRPLVPDMIDDGRSPILGRFVRNPQFLAALVCGRVKFFLIPVEEATMFALQLQMQLD